MFKSIDFEYFLIHLFLNYKFVWTTFVLVSLQMDHTVVPLRITFLCELLALLCFLIQHSKLSLWLNTTLYSFVLTKKYKFRAELTASHIYLKHIFYFQIFTTSYGIHLSNHFSKTIPILDTSLVEYIILSVCPEMRIACPTLSLS